MSDKNKIYLIGAGNLGLHLAKALKKTSYEFTGVFSRQPQNASMAAEILQCKAVDNLYNIPDNTEIIIISVPDSILIEIAKKLKAPEHIVIHTSGSVEMNILKQISPAYGVIYPLQTFSKKRRNLFQ